MRKNFFLSGLVCFFYFSQVFALVGASFHWGFDFTLKMDGIDFEPALFDSLIKPDELLTTIDIIESKLPNEIGDDKIQSFKDTIKNHIDILNENSPVSFRRHGWTRSVINIGGKIYIDDIPIIDAVDVSFNIGAWEYTSELRYPNGQLKKKTIEMSDITDFLNSGKYEDFLQMDTLELSLEEFGYDRFKVFNLSQTPFIKMQFDMTIRKNIIAKPDKMKLFQLYLGLGPSLHFNTPILTPEFIIETVKSHILAAANDISQLGDYLSNTTIMKTVIEKLLDEAKKPTWGMNIVAGTMFKIPVVPLGFYVDMKYMIPFQEFDEIELSGFGILLNTGVCLAL